MSVDSKMTAIADKIRGLLGLSGEMGLDAMATNLTTEQANIAAALAALTEKGVEVPTGANSNALAGLIAAIESGGGEIVTGTVTATNSGAVSIEHGLGRTPTGFALVPAETPESLYSKELVMGLKFNLKADESSASGVSFSQRYIYCKAAQDSVSSVGLGLANDLQPGAGKWCAGTPDGEASIVFPSVGNNFSAYGPNKKYLGLYFLGSADTYGYGYPVVGKTYIWLVW